MNRLSLLMIIANHLDEEKYIDFLSNENARFKNIIHATGTASSSVLEYFGLDEIKKIIMISLLPYNMSKVVLKHLKQNKNIKINEPGNGIAFTIPLSSASKYMLERYNETEVEDIKMKQSNQHLIVTIANEGSAESVMSAAKKAGATGGTTISGRGLEPNQIVKVLGLALEPEKDIVLILASEKNKNKIMEKINEKCGSHTSHAGLCFSLPVEYVVGINNEDEQEKSN